MAFRLNIAWRTFQCPDRTHRVLVHLGTIQDLDCPEIPAPHIPPPLVRGDQDQGESLPRLLCKTPMIWSGWRIRIFPFFATNIPHNMLNIEAHGLKSSCLKKQPSLDPWALHTRTKTIQRCDLWKLR